MSQIELPREVCSSVSTTDSIWSSKGVVVTTLQERDTHIRSECKNMWSPGMTLFITRGTVSVKILHALVAEFLPLSHRLGKARRITLGDPIPSQLLQQLYRCFRCVECMGQDGSIVVLDDGNETVSLAKLV